MFTTFSGLIVSRSCTLTLVVVACLFTVYDLVSQRVNSPSIRRNGDEAHSTGLSTPATLRRPLNRPESVAQLEGNTDLRPLHEQLVAGPTRPTGSSSALSSAKRGGVSEDTTSVANQGQQNLADVDHGPKWTHVHLCAIGDSLTEGITRVFSNPRKLKYRPYAPLVAELLRGHRGTLSNSRVASVSHQTFAFKGRTAGGIVYDTSRKMFGTSVEIDNNFTSLLRPGGDEMKRTPRVKVVPPSLVKALRSGHATIDVAGPNGAQQQVVAIEQILVVCAVMAGTNDVLRARGSAVSSPPLPPIPIDHTINHVVDLFGLCIRYHTQLRREQGEQAAVANIHFLLVPMGLPPAMFDPQSEILREGLIPFLVGKSGGKRSLFGYCLTPQASWKAMLQWRSEIHDMLVSPGRFHEELERFASAVGSSDHFLRAGVGVSKEVVVFDDILTNNISLWSDCLHLTEVGYDLMAARIARVVKQQT